MIGSGHPFPAPLLPFAPPVAPRPHSKMMPLGNREDLDRQEKAATEALLRALGGVDGGGGGEGGGRRQIGDQFYVSDKEVENDYLALLAEAGLEDDEYDTDESGLALHTGEEKNGFNIDMFDDGNGRENIREDDVCHNGDVDNLPPIKRPRNQPRNQSPPPSYTEVMKTDTASTQAEIKRLQSQALAAKRGGDISLAKKYVTQYKALQAAAMLPLIAESNTNPAGSASVFTPKKSDASSSTASEPIEVRMQSLKKRIAAAKSREDFDSARTLFQELKALKLCLKNGTPAPPTSSGFAHSQSKTAALTSSTRQFATAKKRTSQSKAKSQNKQAVLSDLQREIMSVRKRQSEAMQRGDANAAGLLYEEFLELNAQYQKALGMKVAMKMPTKKKTLEPDQTLLEVDAEEERQGSKMNDDDLDVDSMQLSDGDEDDPEILSALSAIEDAEKATAVVGHEVEEEKEEEMPGKLDNSSASLDSRIADIDKEIQNFKVLAVMAKRNGNLSKAKSLFAQFKQRKIDRTDLLQESRHDSARGAEKDSHDDVTLSTRDATKSSSASACTSSLSVTQNPMESVVLEKKMTIVSGSEDVSLTEEMVEIKSQIDQVDAKLSDLKNLYEKARLSGDASLAESLMIKSKKFISEKRELLVIFDEISTEVRASGIAPDSTPDGSDMDKPRPTWDTPAAPATPTAINVLKATPKMRSEPEKVLAMDATVKNQSSRKHLEVLIKEHQMKALAAKKAGDIKECKCHFTAYKALQKQLQDLLAKPLDDGVSLGVDSTSNPQVSGPRNLVHPSRLASLEASAQRARTRALQFKKAGDLTAAKQELAQYKLLKSQINALLVKGGEDVPASAQKEAKRLNAERSRAVDGLDSVVVKEVAIIQRIMKLGQASNDKALVSQLAKALSRAQSQRKVLAQYRPGGTFATRPVPKRCTRTVVNQIKVQNLDVPVNTMRLIIHSINDVPYKGDPDRAVNAFVKFDFGYPRTAPIEGQTPIVAGKGRLASFDKSFSLGLGSGRLSSKATLRHFEKRRMNFSVWHRKSGLFSSEDVCLGKACADLAPLLEKSVLNEIEVPIFQESRRRPSGGHLCVTMKLRQPLQGEDVRSIQRETLVLEK